MRWIPICLVYLILHTLVLWLQPAHYLGIDIALQVLVLLPIVLLDLKAPTSSERMGHIPSALSAASVAIFIIIGLAINHIVVAGKLLGGDEAAYRFQASIFATGHVTTAAPPASVFYEHHIIHGGHWFTKFPPGWPAILALASAVGLGTAINILFGAMILVITFFIGRCIYSDREAQLALLLMVLSPFFLGNCLGHMSHPLCGLLLAGSTYFYFQSRAEGSLRNIGAMLGGIVRIRLPTGITTAFFEES
jgi:hypothetical protein